MRERKQVGWLAPSAALSSCLAPPGDLVSLLLSRVFAVGKGERERTREREKATKHPAKILPQELTRHPTLPANQACLGCLRPAVGGCEQSSAPNLTQHESSPKHFWDPGCLFLLQRKLARVPVVLVHMLYIVHKTYL